MSSITVTKETLLGWIEDMGYCLHDRDLSLNNADPEIIELLQSHEMELRELAMENDIDWLANLQTKGVFTEEPTFEFGGNI